MGGGGGTLKKEEVRGMETVRPLAEVEGKGFRNRRLSLHHVVARLACTDSHSMPYCHQYPGICHCDWSPEAQLEAKGV